MNTNPNLVNPSPAKARAGGGGGVARSSDRGRAPNRAATSRQPVDQLSVDQLPPAARMAQVATQPTQLALTVTAHDMKNHLAVIFAAAQLLDRDVQGAVTADSEHVTMVLAMIQRSALKAQTLLEEFLDLATLQAGESVQMYLEPVDLVALTQAIVKEYQFGTGHYLTLVTPSVPLVGTWDAPRLERVVANLLRNAIKYSADTSTVGITIATDDVGDGALLTIHDDGIGIPSADLAYIFEPFFRASNVVPAGGNGIGLFSARAIIEQQGGTLTLESMEGKGTTVSVWLPRMPCVVPRLIVLPGS